MNDTLLSSIAARSLFTAVKNTNKLETLYINNNAINDDVADDIATALTINKSLVELEMYGNPISGKAIVTVLQAINSTLQRLWVPTYNSEIKRRIVLIGHEINSKRLSQGIQEQLMLQFPVICISD